MDGKTPKKIRGWAELRHGEDLVIVAIVELPDWLKRDRASVENESDLEGVAARWFGAELEGAPAIGLIVAEVRGEEPRHAVWVLPHPPLSSVEAARSEQRMVALVADDDPKLGELATATSIDLDVLTRATHVDVHGPAESMLRLHGALVSEADPVGMVDVLDADALARQAAPLRSRLALADGEVVDDDQLVPMAWRPWHYNRVKDAKGLRWKWPVQQIYFQLQPPPDALSSAVPPPDAATAKRLRGYLSTVDRLSRSQAVNEGGAIKFRWTREEGTLPVEVKGPHEDALDTVLVHLRKLMDANEESGFSFSRVLGALSAAAHRSGNDQLKAVFKQWKAAEQGIRRKHHRALQHELAVELDLEPADDPIRGPLPGVTEITPEALIRAFMYGEVLHVKEGLEQVEAWDSDPVLGPFMRQEVRSDANSFVHFYGAFAAYVDAWLCAHEEGQPRESS